MGTDWPHPNVRGDMPDDGELCDAFFLACPEDEARRQVLVHNPARLYGFPDPSAAPGRAAWRRPYSIPKETSMLKKLFCAALLGLAAAGAAAPRRPCG